jgi:phage tail-like protein
MATNYPITAFHFRVEWGGAVGAFTEVSGLNLEHQVVEYRDGLSNTYSTIKMPGLNTNGEITLKRGIFRKNNEFYDWWNTVSMNNVERRDITVSLLDENHEATMVWTFTSAWPSKIEGASLNSTGNEVAIETITLVHEGMTIAND